MNTAQLLNLTQRDLMKMTDAELRKAVSTLRSTSRKRYERITRSGKFKNGTKATRKLERGGGLPPVKTLQDRESLINEFKRYKGFLKMKTSTLGGSKEYKEKLKDALKEGAGLSGESGTVFDNDDMLDMYTDILDDLEEANLYEIYYRKYMENLARTIKEHPDKSREDIEKIVRDRVDEWYEEERRKNGEYGVYTSNLV